jgi:hypothetical protein
MVEIHDPNPEIPTAHQGEKCGTSGLALPMMSSRCMKPTSVDLPSSKQEVVSGRGLPDEN